MTIRAEAKVQSGLEFQGFADLAQAAEWYDRWARTAAMPLWWKQGGDLERGGFHEALSVEGVPRPGARRARVQSRQVYCYATAGAMNWDGPWREAAWHGMTFFIERFRREDGLFRTLVGLDGAVLDDTAMLYDQAFALLATATLHKMDAGDGRLPEVALGVLAGLDTMRHPAGGFRENVAYPFQANAHMHILEGALAWAEHGLDTRWDALADEIVEMALRVFIDHEGGFLREFFNADWTVASGDDGRLLEPGHQFEWAWLLERWGRLRGREDAVTAARGLYAAGRRGIDPERGVVINELWDDFSVREATARLWPQTERLKAELVFGGEADQIAAAAGLRLYLAMPMPGVWRDKLRADRTFIDEPAPATSFYHILCACTELFRLAGR
ncbi:AGE family epimerase/isomerase [Phenylobacterium sp.]|uniref:AGE family epimerase/isomerase n=1 Tax=Phenylobacterium sp. TaxID=1871053 RepID=UPI002731F5DB|nr:AGE family epimerase/isomerase [Phenylobacterium sp.]MDP1598206.1 AGE family epimerase/isomerase [Phenylobacterium sp.]MDP3594730.1 AGE family epimerase/isomerase [Phenylobacterium sp.]